MEHVINVLKGAVIGIANAIPGVSGGTMMVIMKVFDRLMDAVSFDLKKLKFMDSAGLGIIIGRYKNVLATGGKTFVSAPSGHTRRLLTLAGMNKIIPLCKNLDEALGGAAK